MYQVSYNLLFSLKLNPSYQHGELSCNSINSELINMCKISWSNSFHRLIWVLINTTLAVTIYHSKVTSSNALLAIRIPILPLALLMPPTCWCRWHKPVQMFSNLFTVSNISNYVITKYTLLLCLRWPWYTHFGLAKVHHFRVNDSVSEDATGCIDWVRQSFALGGLLLKQ